jgi:hypothetical protein
VHINDGGCNFKMYGGVITGNKAGAGGGVFNNYVESGISTFTKTGGVIYGTDAADDKLKNTSNDGNGGHGDAVRLINSMGKVVNVNFDNTLGPEDDLDSNDENSWDGLE